MKNAKKLEQVIAKGLSTSMIQNTSPAYQSATPDRYHEDDKVEFIEVTLDKLRPYEHNPRKTRNPNFELIKESIRRRGLDHKPNITRRPGETHYIIADGGNTRLQALKELFTETKDPKYWSIHCQYKPWQGDSADNVDAELNLLIGHLIENDTRADLSFIEKALGIQQAKEYYEQKLGKALSSRDLSKALGDDGYPIHHTLIAKMERCVAYLYPYIPEVLFGGLGKPQIDKLLAIYNNAETIWHGYMMEEAMPFTRLWGDILAEYNDPEIFQVRDCQDGLIERMAELLGDKSNYEALYIEIDLDERKFQKLAAKQQEIDSKTATSIAQVAQYQERLQDIDNGNRQSNPSAPLAKPKKTHTDCVLSATNDGNADVNEPEFENDDENFDDLLPNSGGEKSSPEAAPASDVSPENEMLKYVTQNLGLTPGMSIQAQREKRAEENGLTFALVGRQPVDDIWSIYPGRQYRSVALSLALDIAESVGIEALIEHGSTEPSYLYRMKDVEQPLSEQADTIYHLLTLLQTHDYRQVSCTLDSDFLFGANQIDDVTLVKLFRLIRVVRHLRGVSHA